MKICSVRWDISIKKNFGKIIDKIFARKSTFSVYSQYTKVHLTKFGIKISLVIKFCKNSFAGKTELI